MGCINNQTDMLRLTKRTHRLLVEGAVYPLSMMQGDVLLPCLRAVEIRRTSLLQHLYSLTAFCRSSEYQYHAFVSSPFLNRWVKCLL